MNIGFLVPIQGINEYGKVYSTIVNLLEKKGHLVIHPLTIAEHMLANWNQHKCEAFFADYYTKINKSDLIVAECSYPCVGMGLEIASAIQLGKHIIILKAKSTELTNVNFDPLYTKKNIYVYEYQSHNLKETVEAAIAYNPSQKYQKYNILFTTEMLARLTTIAKKKNLPKSVYIRQLIEKGLEEDK